MMQSGGIHAIEIVFLLLLLFVVIFATLARKLQTPYPIVLVVAGLFLSFIPGIPRIPLNPDVIFLVVLPPLLYSAAWLTSWREFKFNLVSILFLAIGLVGFTVLGVTGTAAWVFPGFDWRLGLVLGAVVATTDAIAATAIAKRVGLPQRIVDILEAESLVNDATAPPPDLTTLAQRHDGKFPAEYVAGIVRFGQPIAAHGSSDMPVWGPIFAVLEHGNEVAVRKRIQNLVNCLATIQQKES